MKSQKGRGMICSNLQSIAERPSDYHDFNGDNIGDGKAPEKHKKDLLELPSKQQTVPSGKDQLLETLEQNDTDSNTIPPLCYQWNST